MPNYATAQEYINEFADEAEVARVLDNTGSPDTTKINAYLDSAEAFINGKVAIKHAVPISVASLAANPGVANLLKRLTLILAVWMSVGQRNDIISDAKKFTLEWAWKMLDDLATGKFTLPGVSAIPDETLVEVRAEYGFGDALTSATEDTDGEVSSGHYRVFTRDSMGQL